MAEPVIVEKRESIETLGSNGETLGQNQNLNDIFNRIEKGESADDAIKAVMTPQDDEGKDKEEKVVAPPADDQKETVTPSTDEGKEKAEGSQEKTTPKTVKPDDDEQVADDELAVLPHDKPKTAKRIRALLNRIDTVNATFATTKKELEEKVSKLKELETELQKVKSADPVVSEEIKAQLDDLKMYRRRYALEKDPEVGKRFDGRISQGEDTITAILKGANAGDTLLNMIKAEGGWTKFTESGTTVTLNEGTKMSAAELAEAIMAQLPYGKRKAIDAAALDQQLAKQERDRFFAANSKETDDYFRQKEEQAQKQQQEYQANIKKAQDAVVGWLNDIEKKDFMQLQTVPATATSEEKAAIEEENRYVTQMHEFAKKYSSSYKLEDVLSAMTDAVMYHQTRRENAKLLARSKALEAKVAELERFKAASKTTTKPGSIASGSSQAPARPAQKRDISLEERFAAMERGEGPEVEE